MNIPDPFLQSWEWRTVRMRVLERDGAKCVCCGADAADGTRMNVDHIKPRRRFPELALTESNLQVLCEVCNHGKGNTFDTDWRKPRTPTPLPRMSLLDIARAAVEKPVVTPQENSRLEQLKRLMMTMEKR